MNRLGLFDDRQNNISQIAMDAAATQSQSPQHFTTTSPISSSKTIGNAAADLVQLNASNLIKNKRKNFSPRCSSTVENDLEMVAPSCEGIVGEISDLSKRTSGQFDPQLIHHHQQDESAINSGKMKSSGGAGGGTINNLISTRSPPQQEVPSAPMPLDLEVMALNWRQLLASHHYRHHHHQLQGSQTVGSGSGIDPAGSGGTGTGNGIELPESTLYKIPNTNFTITKSSNALSPGIDSESKTEFAYNAFTRELLKVYALSISPDDIVEAFKKQQAIGNILQPPTPPRSPNTSSTVIPTASSTTSTISESRLNGTFIDPQPSGSRQSNITNCCSTNQSKDLSNIDEITISPASGQCALESSPPHITIAPVSKLMGIHQNFQQQQHNTENHRSTITKGANFNTSECEDDDHRSATTPDDDDDVGDDGDYVNQKQNQQQITNSGDVDCKDNSSDRDNSPRPTIFDLGRLNDDSNVSTTDRHSDDQGSDDFGSNSTNPMDYDSSRLSVKNVENILDKCSLGLFSPLLQLAQMQSEDKQIQADTIKNLTKFSSYLECKNNQCQLENLREHYHCYDLPCFGKVLSKKEEIIRHLKWHKKRNESLNHGFLRFSSTDDCSSTFGPNCTHNRKQTHYHCFQPNCDKVYISTSDVQMHSNYHRKDSAIFQEGFQRYRATEECNADYCMFSGQRTTHFHCRRDNCRFTFKNKADMEKHKSYHIKDLQLARDGFKKFLKTEACPYERCRFSRICNHIHCVRENCYYVLHSSGQLLSHKRKHERMDSEQAYRRFKMIQKAALFGHDLSQLAKGVDSGVTVSSSGGGGGGGGGGGVSSKPSTPSTSSSAAISPDLQIAAVAHGVLANSLLPTDLSAGFTNTKFVDGSVTKSGSIPVPDLSLFYGGTGLPIDFLHQMQQRQQQLLRQQGNTTFMEAMSTTNEKNFNHHHHHHHHQQQPQSPKLDHHHHHHLHHQNPAISDNLLISMMANSGYTGAAAAAATSETTTSTPTKTATTTTPPTASSSSTGGATAKNTTSLEDFEQMIRQYFTDNCTRQIVALDPQNQQIEPLNLNLRSSGGGGSGGGSTAGCGGVKQDRENNSPGSAVVITTMTTTTTAGTAIPSTTATTTTTTTSTTGTSTVMISSVATAATASSSSISDRIECFLSTNEPHMHCLIKDCEAVVPRSITDITDHMRMHEINRNAEGSNLLQITSIEGFFNRKRGRPPKNRVVEVYNNAQQSPQAIFTSFKLEKTLNEPFPPRSSATTTPSQGANPSTIASESFHHTENSFPGSEDRNQLNERKFRVYQPNERCLDPLCPYTNQMHFHCVQDESCKFSTPHGAFIEIHQHSASGGEMYSEFFKYFETSVDCNVHECNYRGVKSHFHCTRCGNSITSKSDLQLHICICNPSSIDNQRISSGKSLFNLTTNLPHATRSVSASSGLLTSPNSHQIDSTGSSLLYANPQNSSTINDNGPGGGGNPTNERLGTHDETDLDCTYGVKSESSEEDRVSVVRAAGTYFPENSENSDHSATLIPATGQIQGINEAIPVCQRPFCKLKRKLHHHCELCNQAFSDRIKLKIHRLKHSSTRLGQLMDVDGINEDINCEQEIVKSSESNPNSSNEQIDQPQDLSLVSQSQTSPGGGTMPSAVSSILPQNFVDNFSMQNLHLAHLALYQQNPFYYQNFYPFLGSHGLPLGHPDFLKCQFDQPSTSSKTQIKHETLPAPFPFVAAAAVAAAAASSTNQNVNQTDSFGNLRQKRKPDDYSGAMDLLPAKKVHKTGKQGNFKIFKDEPVPHGYLKFRFNEDCNFPNCGYRNHQSHFHCRRNDCYYSFCDKTRFVQHTARHERLDKLMGDDFKQYRANMRCGYEDCAYNKNVGQNNKSSHFHCLKCNFICSDTNKVVAHRRQHSKMEFIRMAGFRKVGNNEKCSASDQDASNGECTYSLKQTHYHCLVCDCSVLSRAQLGSHRHRVQ